MRRAFTFERRPRVPEILPCQYQAVPALPFTGARGAFAGLRRIVAVAMLLAMLVAGWPARAQGEGAAGQAASAPVRAPVPARISVLNRHVVTLRSDFLGNSPQDRARRAEEVIGDVLDRGGPGTVSVQGQPQGKAMMIDGSFVFLLTPGDADAVGGQTPEAQVASAQQALEQAIAATRESRDRGRLMWATVHAVTATVIFAVLVWGLMWLRRKLVVHTTRLLAAKTAGVKLAGLPLFRFTRLYEMSSILVRLVAGVVLAMLSYEWLAYVLKRFPVTRPWGEQLGSFVFGVARRIGGGIVDALPDLCVALVIFALARGVVLTMRPVFHRVEQGRSALGWLDADLVAPTRRIFEIVVWLFAIAMAYPYLPGSQSDAFKGISVLIGLMVTLGGSNLVGQAASGMILMYSRTVRVGEYVRIQEQEGTVVDLGTFTTKIRTGLGEEITFPNAVIMANVTKNYSRTVRGTGYILDTTMTIGYDTPWRQVQAMMLEAARRTEGVVADPAPQVFQTALQDYYVEYRLVCQAIPTRPRPRAEALAALHANLLDVFNTHGVQIMSPHYLGDPADVKVVPPENWWAAPAARPPQREGTSAS